MASYRYSIAKDAINDNDKNRLLCLFLSCPASAIDWKRATQEYGSASVESMRVCTRAIYKKLDEAGARINPDGSDADLPPPKATPSKATNGKATAGKKRKTATAKESDGDVDDEEVALPETKPKAKRGRPSKKAKADTPIEDPFEAFTHIENDEEEEAKSTIKEEPF